MLDADTLAAAKCGDEAAFRRLWRTLQPPLLRYLAVRDPDRCDDLASETWLHVVRDIRRFRGSPDEFRAWVFAVARHRSVDSWRARARRPSHAVEDLEVSSGCDLTEQSALERLTTAEAVALIRTLPTDQADVLALRLIADLDVHATAALLGKSTGAVRVLAHRGLKTLGQRLRDVVEQA